MRLKEDVAKEVKMHIDLLDIKDTIVGYVHQYENYSLSTLVSPFLEYANGIIYI